MQTAIRGIGTRTCVQNGLSAPAPRRVLRLFNTVMKWLPNQQPSRQRVLQYYHRRSTCYEWLYAWFGQRFRSGDRPMPFNDVDRQHTSVMTKNYAQLLRRDDDDWYGLVRAFAATIYLQQYFLSGSTTFLVFAVSPPRTTHGMLYST